VNKRDYMYIATIIGPMLVL